MKIFLFLPIVSFLITSSLFAQKKETVELQRDLALLQDQVRSMQRSMDEKLGALTVMIQQTLDSSNKANTAVAVLESGIRDKMRDQEAKLVVPVTNVGAKVDSFSEEMKGLRGSVDDLNAKMGKMQAQLVDLGNAVKTLAAPPIPPPAAATTAPAAPTGPPVGLSAESLYNNAMRDRLGGNADLALAGFNDYLRYFGNTDLAPNSQYYIGELYYNKGDMDAALRAFDTVLEKYPDNNKTPDAMYMKGKVLVKMSERDEAAKQFRDLRKRYPTHDLSAKALSELRAMGLSGATPSGTKKRRN
jgi:tol-pal system protein YbgF